MEFIVNMINVNYFSLLFFLLESLKFIRSFIKGGYNGEGGEIGVDFFTI